MFRHALLRICLMLAGIVLYGDMAAAQAPEPPPRREGGAELSFVDTNGNTESMALGVKGDFTLRPKPWIIEERAHFIRTESDDIVDAESFTNRFRAGRYVTTRLDFFAMHGYLRDTFSGIDHRNTITFGLGYALIEDARQTLKVDGSFGYVNEQRIGDDISTGVVIGGTKYRLQLTANAELADDFSFEEAFDDAGNWRLDHFIGLTAKISTIFSLKVGNSLRFANQPVPGFLQRDLITSAALVMRFKSS
jgi:putative salt-induced outer membrane protein YdiY